MSCVFPLVSGDACCYRFFLLGKQIIKFLLVCCCAVGSGDDLNRAASQSRQWVENPGRAADFQAVPFSQTFKQCHQFLADGSYYLEVHHYWDELLKYKLRPEDQDFEPPFGVRLTLWTPANQRGQQYRIDGEYYGMFRPNRAIDPTQRYNVADSDYGSDAQEFDIYFGNAHHFGLVGKDFDSEKFLQEMKELREERPETYRLYVITAETTLNIFCSDFRD